MAFKQHTGGCQCGAVRFEVTTDLDETIMCNCSRCAKLGAILAFAPAEHFKLTSGADAQTEYRFHKKVIEHLFCSTCGIESFARGQMPDGSPIIAINVRCLDDIDFSALTPKPVDGRSY